MDAPHNGGCPWETIVLAKIGVDVVKILFPLCIFGHDVFNLNLIHGHNNFFHQNPCKKRNENSSSYYSLAAIVLDLLILLCLWQEDVKVWPIAVFENYSDPSNIDISNADVIIDSSLYTIGIFVVFFLRTYLRCIKKVQDANAELISIKVWIVHLIQYLSF